MDSNLDLKATLIKQMAIDENLPPKEKHKIVEEFQEKVDKLLLEIKKEVYPNEPVRLSKEVRNHYLRHPVDCKPFEFLLLCYGTDLFFNNFPIKNCPNPSYSWGLDVVIDETDIRFSFSLREDAKLLLLDELEQMFELNPEIADYVKVNNYKHDVLFVNSYSKKIPYNNIDDVIPIIDGEFIRFKNIYEKSN